MTDHFDPDEHLTPYERTRKALHRAIDRICDAWPQALEDADARGFGTGRRYDATGGGGACIVVKDEYGQDDTVPVTAVEATALNPSRAVAWLAELGDTLNLLCGPVAGWEPKRVRRVAHPLVEALCADWGPGAEDLTRRLIRLANCSALLWPRPLRAGETASAVTVGGRTNTVEMCVYCQQPVTGGAADPIRRVGVDSDPVHKSPCWYALMVSRGQHPRQTKEAS